MAFIILIDFFEAMSIWLNEYMETYDNIITLEDFNITDENPQLSGFMQSYNIPHLINEPTGFQSHDPTCIDNIPTKGKNILLVPIIIKWGSFKGPQRTDRSYENFDLECFNIHLKAKLDSIEVSTYNKFD